MATRIIVQKQTVLQPAELQAELERKATIAWLKSFIFRLWFNRTENRYFLGQRLWQLQYLHGKPGSGTFLEDVDELEIPRATAYRYIAFYLRVELGHDPTPCRLSQIEKDKLFATLDGPDDFVDEEKVADETRLKVAAAISSAKRDLEIARALNKGKPGVYHVKVNFTELEIKQFKPVYNKWGIDKASDIIFEAMMNYV